MSKTAAKPRETRRYNLEEDRKQVQRWCELFPWYKSFVDDVHHLLAQRDHHSGDVHSLPVRPRNTSHHAA